MTVRLSSSPTFKSLDRQFECEAELQPHIQVSLRPWTGDLNVRLSSTEPHILATQTKTLDERFECEAELQPHIQVLGWAI